ncbi:MAG TPA: hypothetical protein VNN08_19830 [Thermoanaerobaculia bacterium]|nr:hypothetical protein [Thermoanaerobaculia bacterium]
MKQLSADPKGSAFVFAGFIDERASGSKLANPCLVLEDLKQGAAAIACNSLVVAWPETLAARKWGSW